MPGLVALLKGLHDLPRLRVSGSLRMSTACLSVVRRGTGP